MNDFRQRDWLRGLVSDFYIFVVAVTICIGFIICCSSCSSARPVVFERVLHDTAYVERVKVDSVLHRDSVYLEVFTKGDTVYRTKYVDRWRDRVSIKRDTVYLLNSDEVKVPQPAEARKVSKWERAALWVATFMKYAVWVGIAFLIIGYIGLRHRKI